MSLESSAKDPAFATTVQNKYMLSNEQMKAMTDAGLKGSQLAMTTQIAASSGKPIEDIVKMRTEGKMGWGKISKLLGVQPGVIVESVSSLRHEKKDERKARKEHRKKQRADKKLAREEKKAERKANAEESQSQHHKNK